MARTPKKLYHVHKAQDGSQIVTGVPLAVARSEAARLNAEARVQVGTMAAVYDRDGAMVQAPAPIFAGMVHGEISRYEVRSAEGLVIA